MAGNCTEWQKEKENIPKEASSYHHSRNPNWRNTYTRLTSTKPRNYKMFELHRSTYPGNVWGTELFVMGGPDSSKICTSYSSAKLDLHPNQHTLLLQKMLMRLYSDDYNSVLEHSLLNTKKRHTGNLIKSGWCPVQSENISVFLLRQKYRVGGPQSHKCMTIWRNTSTRVLWWLFYSALQHTK